MNGSIIVTTYNRPTGLVKVLNGLTHLIRAADEVIVTDDGSHLETAICFNLRHAENSRNQLTQNDEIFRKARQSNDYHAHQGLV